MGAALERTFVDLACGEHQLSEQAHSECSGTAHNTHDATRWYHTDGYLWQLLGHKLGAEHAVLVLYGE